jgi:hypothetical protein
MLLSMLGAVLLLLPIQFMAWYWSITHGVVLEETDLGSDYQTWLCTSMLISQRGVRKTGKKNVSDIESQKRNNIRPIVEESSGVILVEFTA